MSVGAGFDLGATQLKYGLVDPAGKILYKNKIPTPPEINALLDVFGAAWADLKRQTRRPIAAAGFGIPGIYDLKAKRILQSPNYPGLDNFDLYGGLGRRIEVPVLVDNDANMAAFGEWAAGAGRGVSSMALLTVGTGIGGGLILDGKLWQGGSGYAGEVGHMTVHPDGRRCNCGLRGCLETEASAPAIVRRYLAMTKKRERLTTEDIYRRAKAGDKNARRAFAQAGYFLGIGLGILINLLNPEKILLGGGVMTTGEYLLRPTIREARRRSYAASFARCSIERASLGNDAGLIGAALWAGRNFDPRSRTPSEK